MKKADSIDWNSVAEHITRERFVVTGLAAGESYQFRVHAANVLGWGEWSDSSLPIQTLNDGAQKLGIFYLSSQLKCVII